MKTSTPRNLLFAAAAVAATVGSVPASAQNAPPTPFKDPGGIMTAVPTDNTGFVAIATTKDGKTIGYYNYDGYVDANFHPTFNPNPVRYDKDPKDVYGPKAGTIYCGVTADILPDSYGEPSGTIYLNVLFIRPTDKFNSMIVPKWLTVSPHKDAPRAFEEWSKAIADIQANPEMVSKLRTTSEASAACKPTSQLYRLKFS